MFITEGRAYVRMDETARPLLEESSVKFERLQSTITLHMQLIDIEFAK